MRHTALSLHRTTSFPSSMADVRGYEVRTRDNDEKVGKVGDLVCAADGKIRYLDVDVGGLFNKKRVLLPIGVARVDKRNDVLWVAGMTKEQVKDLPDYDGNPDAITDDYEQQCCGPFLSRGTAPLADARPDATADEELYDQGRFYADRGGAAARDGRIVFSPDAQPSRDREERV
ncbi:MAG: PRC-barrel domain-containing protein [Gemmatimonadaceae bacterium]